MKGHLVAGRRCPRWITLSTALQPWEGVDGQLTRHDARGLASGPALVAGRTTVRLPLAAIVVPPSATRRDMGDLAGLAQTLNEHGLLQPILVRPDGARYVLVFGERRLRAAQLAGWQDIEALVLELSDEDAEILALVENLQWAAAMFRAAALQGRACINVPLDTRTDGCRAPSTPTGWRRCCGPAGRTRPRSSGTTGTSAG